MKKIILICSLTMASACSAAHSAEITAEDPLHCATGLEIYSKLALYSGDEKLSQGYRARGYWFARKAVSLAGKDLSRETTDRLVSIMVDDVDGTLRLVEECIRIQDADPEFQAILESNRQRRLERGDTAP